MVYLLWDMWTALNGILDYISYRLHGSCFRTTQQNYAYRCTTQYRHPSSLSIEPFQLMKQIVCFERALFCLNEKAVYTYIQSFTCEHSPYYYYLLCLDHHTYPSTQTFRLCIHKLCVQDGRMYAFNVTEQCFTREKILSKIDFWFRQSISASLIMFRYMDNK